MTLDIDKIRAERKEQEGKSRAEIAALTADLERVLSDPSPHINPLERQADLLDCLLYAVMRRNLSKDKESGNFSESGIALALRIQKQGMDTAKAAGALSYMNAIASLHAGVYPPMAQPPLPTPLENDERTVKGT